MATKNPRINITLDPETLDAVYHLAKKSSKSVSAQASELLRQALELHEDYMLSKVANKRSEIDADKPVYSHEDAWK